MKRRKRKERRERKTITARRGEGEEKRVTRGRREER
jgi:hypothetical protein